MFFFFQAEDGIRDDLVTGVQTCALPIYECVRARGPNRLRRRSPRSQKQFRAKTAEAAWRPAARSALLPGRDKQTPACWRPARVEIADTPGRCASGACRR